MKLNRLLANLLENKENLKALILQLIKITLAILLLFFLPVIITLFLPIHIVRFCVQKLAKIMRPDLSEMVNCSATTVLHGSNTSEKPRLVVISNLIFKGKLDYKRATAIIQSRCLDLKHKNGSLRYPEMIQYLTSWMGFNFWKPDPSFNLTNHVKVRDLGKSIVTLDDIKNLEEELVIAPFQKDRSPWEIIIVHNVSIGNAESLNSAFIIRWRHVLGDGYSLLKLTKGFCEVSNSDKIKANYAKKSMIENIIFPFKCLYVLAEIIVEMFTKYPFKISSSTRSFNDSIQRSDIVTVQAIKDIKNNANVSFLSVVISIATGAFRSMALRNGIKLPKTIPCLIPMPRPGHPLKLRNHFTMAVVNLPVGEPNAAKRLQLCHKEYERIKSSAYPTVAYLWVVLTGGCFNFICRTLCQVTSAAVTVSYVPLTLDKCSFDGHEFVTHSFCYGPNDVLGAGIFISGVLDHLTFYTVVDHAVLLPEEVLGFKKIINNEVNTLGELSYKLKLQ